MQIMRWTAVGLRRVSFRVNSKATPRIRSRLLPPKRVWTLPPSPALGHPPPLLLWMITTLRLCPPRINWPRPQRLEVISWLCSIGVCQPTPHALHRTASLVGRHPPETQRNSLRLLLLDILECHRERDQARSMVLGSLLREMDLPAACPHRNRATPCNHIPSLWVPCPMVECPTTCTPRR